MKVLKAIISRDAALFERSLETEQIHAREMGAANGAEPASGIEGAGQLQTKLFRCEVPGLLIW